MIPYSRVNSEIQPEVSPFNCLSRMFKNNLLSSWTTNDQPSGKTVKIKFDDSKGEKMSTSVAQINLQNSRLRIICFILHTTLDFPKYLNTSEVLKIKFMGQSFEWLRIVCI
jgi:hypothetical protein